MKILICEHLILYAIIGTDGKPLNFEWSSSGYANKEASCLHDFGCLVYLSQARAVYILLSQENSYVLFR